MKRTWHTLLLLAGVLAVTNGLAAAEPSTPDDRFSPFAPQNLGP